MKLRTPDHVSSVKIVNFPKLKRSGNLLVRTLLAGISWSESYAGRWLAGPRVWLQSNGFLPFCVQKRSTKWLDCVLCTSVLTKFLIYACSIPKFSLLPLPISIILKNNTQILNSLDRTLHHIPARFQQFTSKFRQSLILPTKFRQNVKKSEIKLVRYFFGPDLRGPGLGVSLYMLKFHYQLMQKCLKFQDQ